MRLYDLFVMVGGEISKGDLLLESQKIYGELTKVEKVMVDYKIIINDLFPSYYLKLLVSIYIIIEKIDLSVNNNFKMVTLFEKLLLIDYKDTNHTNKGSINSIYDLYKNYKNNYRPFSKTCIDEKLKSRGYNLDYIIDNKDKIILYIREILKEKNITRIEQYFINNNHFMICLDFNNLYESLTNFKDEKRESINYPEINYDILLKESIIFKREIIKDNYSNKDRTLEKILKKEFPLAIQKCKIILRKILSHDYDISIYDVELSLKLMGIIFEDNSFKYINSILYKLKQRKIPSSIIMSYDRIIGIKYVDITLDLEYILRECTNELFKQEFSNYGILNVNLEGIAKSCNNMDIFLYFINRIKEIFTNHDFYIQLFILRQLKEINDPFVNLHESFPDIKIIMLDVKYDILVIYLERNKIDMVQKSIEYVKDYNFNDPRVSYAVGKSCNKEIFYLLYGNRNIEEYNKDVLKNITCGCFSKGSDIFFKMFYSSLDNIVTDEIITNLIKSFNTILLLKYIPYITSDNFIRYLIETIKDDNIVMFQCLLHLVSIEIKNHDQILFNICILNRLQMLNFMIEINNYNPDYIIKIVEICLFQTNKLILNKLFNLIGHYYDFNHSQNQLFKLKRIVTFILNSSRNDLKEWFLEKVTIVSLLKDLSINNNDYINKRRKILHKYSDISYISSDEDEENEDDSELEMEKI